MDRSDQLGKLIKENVCALQSSDWLSFIIQAKKKKCIHRDVGKLPHPAAKVLDHIRVEGAPATFDTPAWTVERNDEAVNRGCHKSAKEYQGFLEQELHEFCKQDYYIVLPYWAVRQLENLRICPIGVVPQRARQPRPISDYTYWGTNEDTVKIAPREAMQFGRTLIYNNTYNKAYYKVGNLSQSSMLNP